MLLCELYDNLLYRYYIVENSVPLTLNSRNYDLLISFPFSITLFSFYLWLKILSIKSTLFHDNILNDKLFIYLHIYNIYLSFSYNLYMNI